MLETDASTFVNFFKNRLATSSSATPTTTAPVLARNNVPNVASSPLYFSISILAVGMDSNPPKALNAAYVLRLTRLISFVVDSVEPLGLAPITWVLETSLSIVAIPPLK